MDTVRLKTNTTSEAMELLKRTRRERITAARAVADELIAANGSTTGKAVCEAMAQRDMLDPTEPEHWLGPLFQLPKYRWTGELTVGRGHAGRGAKVWTRA